MDQALLVPSGWNGSFAHDLGLHFDGDVDDTETFQMFPKDPAMAFFSYILPNSLSSPTFRFFS